MSFYFSGSSQDERERYKKMLVIMGSLSNLFSNNKAPYLASRATENIFCRYLNARNLSRDDSTADAVKDGVGIGIKTWIGTNKQKVAEFNAQRSTYAELSDEEVVRQVSNLRNERIEMTMRRYGLSRMVYHCTIRKPGEITINECPLEKINIQSISDVVRSRNIISFNDGLNSYSFNMSKSTLYKDLSNLIELDSMAVEILDDPFALLEEKLTGRVLNEAIAESVPGSETVYLPLYSYTKTRGKYVPEKAGLNIRFAGGRKRDIYECYIHIPIDFNRKYRSFFPSSDMPFTLILPDGRKLSAKICQENDKALMTNPNRDLGHWLIDDILKINPQNPITYEDLSKYEIDSVKITKDHDGNYLIDFASLGSYEKFMNEENRE